MRERSAVRKPPEHAWLSPPPPPHPSAGRGRPEPIAALQQLLQRQEHRPRHLVVRHPEPALALVRLQILRLGILQRGRGVGRRGGRGLRTGEQSVPWVLAGGAETALQDSPQLEIISIRSRNACGLQAGLGLVQCAGKPTCGTSARMKTVT